MTDKTYNALFLYTGNSARKLDRLATQSTLREIGQVGAA